MIVEKPKPKYFFRTITTGALNSTMNQADLLKAREKSQVHGAMGFGFVSHWLKNWRDIFKPITKRSNRKHAVFCVAIFFRGRLSSHGRPTQTAKD